MLVSPIRVYGLLSGLLGASDADGPHTALLITPQGQLLAKATVDDEDFEENGDAEGDGEDGADKEDEEEQEDGDEDDDDEPYLEGPERLRLLLGLASQWEEDESPRVECEVGEAAYSDVDDSLDASSCARSHCPSLKTFLRTPLQLYLRSSPHTSPHSCWS